MKRTFIRLADGTQMSPQEKQKLTAARKLMEVENRRRKYHATKGLTAAQRMMGETK